MSEIYDTGEIRRAARKIKSCAENLADSAEPKLNRVRREIPDNFQGKAAEALSERVDDLYSDVRSIGKGLKSLYRALINYAEALEEADRKMAEKL